MERPGTYLPRWATVGEATAWLEAETGQQWPLARFLDSPVELTVEVCCRDDESAYALTHIFLGRRESFVAKITSAPDRASVAFNRAAGKLSVFERPDGRTIRVTPPITYALEDVRVSRDDLRQLADAIRRGINLDDDRRVHIRAAGMGLVEDGRGLASWIAMQGGLEGAKLEGIEFQAADPVPEADRVQAVPDDLDGAPRGGWTSVVHSTKTKQRDEADDIIDAALKAAGEAANDATVWTEAQRLVESDSPPGTAIGILPGRGLRFRKNGELKILTRDAFMKRLKGRRKPP